VVPGARVAVAPGVMVTDETVATQAAREEEPGGDVDPAGHRCAALPGAGPPRQKEPAGQGAQPGP